MAVDLDALEATLVQLNADADALGKIVNDAADAANGAEEAGTVTTRTGDVVKNVQRVLSEIDRPATSADVTTTIESLTSVTYTTVAADNGKYKELTDGTAVAVSVDGFAGHATGDEISFEQTGIGALTFTGTNGMTINSRGGLTSTNGQYSVVTLKFKSATVATLYGDLA